MSFTLIQSGAALQLVSDAGVVSAALTLPTGVTLRTDVPPRFIIYDRYIVLVNTPSQPLTIDGNGVVRLLSPKAPRLAPILSAVAGGTLSGTYAGVRYTFVTLDTQGNIISESDFSPPSNSVTLTSQFLKAASLDVSPDAITERILYRPTNGGAVLFQWVTLDGNILTSVQDDLADAGLSLFAAPVLGTPPRLTHIAEFRGRLWGVGEQEIDNLRYTEAGVKYAWPADNIIPVPSIGMDDFGVVALVPRREALGVGRKNMLVQITGSGVEDTTTGDVDFDTVILSKELGVESQESVKVFRDIAYFLWKDGVYQWSSEGLKCISDGTPDGLGNVRSWFITDSYFNRDMFSSAFALINPYHPYYRLFLASAGSSTIDTWVDYDIDDNTWWGPHRTDLFSPTSGFARVDAANKFIPVIGSIDSLYNDQNTRTDGSGTAITFDAIGKRHALEAPDIEKYFGQISLLGKAQPTGLLSVISRIGNLNETQTLTQYYDMRKNRERLGRLGHGKHTQLQFTNAEVGVDVELFGYEIPDINILGRR
jgi:hypothetical protein